MKKFSLLAGCLFITGLSFGQTDLFFSEMVEGAGGGNNDKAIEIFNPTNEAIDVSQYSIRRYDDGNTTIFQEEILMSTNGGSNLLQPGDVWVIINTGATHVQITSAADQISADYTSTAPQVLKQGGAVFANGNDVYELAKWVGGAPGSPGAVSQIVDIFGKKGEDPGLGGWRGVQPGTPSTISSANHSIVRKRHVFEGVTVNPDSFDITKEWLAYSVSNYGNPGPDQEYSQLGSHIDWSNPTGISDDPAQIAFAKAIRMYPNPASGNVNIEFSDATVGQVSVVNALGQQIAVAVNTVGANKSNISLSDLKAGLYFVKFTSQDGKFSASKNLIVQ